MIQAKEDTFHLGAKALIQNKDGNFLLLQKTPKKLTQELPPIWDLPGGRIHRQEALETTLKREVFEETGLKNLTQITPIQWLISPIRIPVKNGDVGLILALFLCEIDQDSTIHLSDEHISFEWADPTQATTMLPNFYSSIFPQLVVCK